MRCARGLRSDCARLLRRKKSIGTSRTAFSEEDVLRYLDGEAVHAYRESWHEWLLRWVRRHQLVLSLILMYLIMRVVVALVR